MLLEVQPLPWVVQMLQEGGRPRSGLLSNTGNELSDETHMLIKRFYWEGTPGREQEGKGAWGDCSVMGSQDSDFMEMGLVPGLSLANHSDSESFLVVQALLSHNGSQREGSVEEVSHGCLLLTFPEFFPFGVPCCSVSLTRTSYCKTVTEWSLWWLTRVGSFGQCASLTQMPCDSHVQAAGRGRKSKS